MLPPPLSRIFADASQKDKVVTVPFSEPAGAILQRFAAGLRRVLLIDGSNHVTGILTQSDLVQFIVNHKDDAAWGWGRACVASTLRGPFPPLSALSDKATVTDCLHRLQGNSPHVVPLIDDNSGRLIASFTPQALVGMSIEAIMSMPAGQSALTFLRDRHLASFTVRHCVRAQVCPVAMH